MSAARWCDFGQHAFAADRPGTVVMGQITRKKDSAYGAQGLEQDVKEMCPECAAETGILTDYEAPPPPLTRKVDMLKELENHDARVTK